MRCAPFFSCGGIILKIHKLTATFGCLDRQTLELHDGLNVLEAPNETGKSSWCAFLSAMLYGINSRERNRIDSIADKNRFAPWSGVSMQGRMECTDSGRELTIIRETKRAAAPMAAFTALRTGTGDEAADLTGSNCGETLLGVPQEVFERSAFIRQASLGITQDAGLEKRILSLVTSGDEDTSYTETAAVLKKQLHRRRHAKSGEIPALESDLADVRSRLRLLDEQHTERTALSARADLLSAQEQELRAGLDRWDRWDAAQRQNQLRRAEASAAEAEEKAAGLRRQLEAEQVPDNETISRLRAAIVNLETTRRGVAKARDARDEADKTLLRMESAANDSPFAGQTAEEAKRDASTPPLACPNMTAPLAVLYAGLFLSGIAFVLLYSQRARLPGWGTPLAWGASALLAGLTILLFLRTRRRGVRTAQSAVLKKRFGTDDPAAIAALADTYYKVYEDREAARTTAAAAKATADSLYAALSSNEQAILLEVRHFAPEAFDIPAADTALRRCAVQRRESVEAESAAREARMRCDVLFQQSPQLSDSAAEAAPPSESREVLSHRLEQVTEERSGLRSRLDRLSGQAAAVGDRAVLEEQASELEARLEALSGEYDAIALALDTLDSANADLQSRFSPALGRRASEIFSQLTGGRYDGVILDRTFRLSAELTGDPVYRDAQLLSAGASDQLYLAVRLAICETVLPQEACVPIILDDALTNFDDDRCAQALRWLRREAEQRQILLFTCHSREAAFFRDDPAVSIQRLTNSGELV